MKLNARRLFAISAVILMLSVIAVPLLAETCHAEYGCTGELCPFCALIDNALATMQAVSCLLVIFAWGFFFAVGRQNSGDRESLTCGLNPIAIKVRMND